MKTQYFVLKGLLIETVLNLKPEQLSVLEQALELAQERLRGFASDPQFNAKMALAFGSGDANALQAAWLAWDFSILSGIEILSAAALNGANGAYAVSTDRVYLSLAFLERHLNDPQGLANLLLEEVGHRIDASLNEQDSPGDEGAIFAALVGGESLSGETLALLKAEEDAGVVNLDGQSVRVEQQNFVGTSSDNTIWGTTGDDLIQGLGGNDLLTGYDIYVNYRLDGNDTLQGGDGNDVLDGGYGNDVLDGGDGNDTLYPGIGADEINGGAGNDLLYLADYDTAATGITVNYNSSTATGTASDGKTFTEVESIRFYGSYNNDIVDFSFGNIVLELFGGSGNDTLKGGINDDTLYGEGGNDSLQGNDGNDLLNAGFEDDFLQGNDGDDILYGGYGNDDLQGGTGSDILYGSDTSIDIYVASGLGEKDRLSGGIGADRFILGYKPLSGRSGVYYDDGNTTTDGSNYFATITDFSPLEDKVQLLGSASNYLLVIAGANTNLYIDKPGSEPDELIAVFEGITGLDPTSNAFDYLPLPVNKPPEGTDKTITFNEDSIYTFSLNDLGFSDPNDTHPDTFRGVKITTLPTSGVLRLFNNSNSKVSLSNVVAGQLIDYIFNPPLFSLFFIPAANANGLDYASFTFQVQDNGGTLLSGIDLDPTPNTITFNVLPVNDAPVKSGTIATLSPGIEDTPYTINTSDLLTGFSDVDGDPLSVANLSATNGTLVNNNNGTYTVTPAPNFNGTLNLTYNVIDGNGGSIAATQSIYFAPDNSGVSTGDPHITTFDQFHYDFQATGDFILARALDSDLEIQVRQTPWELYPTATLNTALATLVDGNRVEFYIDQTFPIVNGILLSLQSGETQTLGQGSITRTPISGYGMQGDLYTLTYSNGDVLSNSIFRGFLMDPSLDLAGSKTVVGLLGNNNGNPDDDLALSNGSVLSNPLDPAVLYGDFAESWRVSDDQSLFSPTASLVALSSGQFDTPDLAPVLERYIFGGSGNDVLIGVQNPSVTPGKGEVDLLMGNAGADSFVLGDKDNPYYVGSGLQDYALIADLWVDDVIQLHGSASDYMLGAAPDLVSKGTGIFLASDPNELIGIIQGDAITNLSLSSSSVFQFV